MQCSSKVHTVSRQLEDELEGSDKLELELEEIKEDASVAFEELLEVEDDDKLELVFKEKEEEEDVDMALDEGLEEKELPVLGDSLLLLLLQISMIVQTSICLQPVVVVVVVVVVAPPAVVI